MAPSHRGWGVSRRTTPGRGAWAPLSDPSPPIASLCVRAATRRAVLVYLIFSFGVFFLPPVVTVASTAATTATAITTTTTTTTGEATATAADEDAENANSSATTPTTAATAATTTTITTPAITTTTTDTAITTTDTDTDTTADKPEPHSQSAVEKDTSSVHPNSHPRPDSHPAPHLDPHLHPPRVLATPKHIFPPDEKIGDDGSKCWLFTHMPKSGGSTIRDLLRDKWGRDKCMKYGNHEWKFGKQKARNILAENYRIFAGSHAETLRRYGGERCQGFTMFRHPIPRVVSAYFYCKKAPVDPLCSTSVMRAVDVDLLTFVQHWGNFGLRLFSLSMVDTDPDDVMDWANRAGQPVGASGWYLQRKYMEAHSERHDAPDAALYSFLAPAKEHLNTSFAAVGILENFQASLSLYDIALQMPGEGWHQWYAKIGPRNVDIEHKREEEEALESSWTDPRFYYFLELDLELYDHAVKVHHEQLERYGLT